jgi:DNA replication protein DnaC
LLELDCQFVEQHQSAVFIGPTGTGKTQLKGTLEKTLKIYIRPALLLLDELGYLPIDRRGANLLFQVVAARYESGAIVLSTNRPLGDWGQTFDVDNTLATAMIDRLMHHGEPILIQGDSYRMKDKGNE